MKSLKKLGFWEVFSIGVSGMIGGGIFAVLGLSIQLSHNAAPVAFLIAGLIALITAYSYSKLSSRYPSEGGTIEFLVKAYGTGVVSGGLNVMLLASYVVMISLYAYAFGSYSANIFGYSEFTKHVLVLVVITVFTLINALGAVITGRTEDALIAFKLSILVLIGAAGLTLVNWGKFSPTTWPTPLNIVTGGMIIFLAYEGFELIANAAVDVDSPKTLSKAFYSSVLVVVAVYVTIAIVTVGNLPYNVIVKARDYALAIAAKPSLGEIGFWLVTLAALASTSSAINATLYGTARASYMVARYGQLPSTIERKVWKGAYEGLIIISLLSLILANTSSLEAISTAGSGGFLVVFLMVNLAALKLRNNVKANPLITSLGVILTLTALMMLIYRIVITNPSQLIILTALVLGSFITETLYRSVTGRRIAEYVDEKLRKREENIRN